MAEKQTHRKPLLDVRDLVAEFNTAAGPLRILDKVNFSLNPAEILALVGETGCGKSVSAKSILNLIPDTVCRRYGRIDFCGNDLIGLSNKEMQAYRGRRIGMIFQNPIASINPVFTLGEQICRLVKIYMDHEIRRRASVEHLSRKKIVQAIARESLERVGLTDIHHLMKAYPHQISGGMAQRFRIATGLLGDPEIMIADEATSALDVTVQAHILRLLKRLSEEKKTAVLFITHDLGIAAQICHRVAVMYSGRIIETAPTSQLFDRPLHPYTKGLLGAVPQLGKARALTQIPGAIPDLRNPPAGCRFHPRCDQAMAQCRKTRPPQIQMDGRLVCCHLYNHGSDGFPNGAEGRGGRA